MGQVRFMVGFEGDLLAWVDEVCGKGGRGAFLAQLARAERLRREGGGPAVAAVASPVRPRVPVPRRAVGGLSKAEEDGISSAILSAVHRQRYSIKGLSVLVGQDEVVVERLVRAMETAGLVKRTDGLVGRGVR